MFILFYSGGEATASGRGKDTEEGREERYDVAFVGFWWVEVRERSGACMKKMKFGNCKETLWF